VKYNVFGDFFRKHICACVERSHLYADMSVCVSACVCACLHVCVCVCTFVCRRCQERKGVGNPMTQVSDTDVGNIMQVLQERM